MRAKKKKLTSRQIALLVLGFTISGVFIAAIPVGFLLRDKIFGTTEKKQKEEKPPQHSSSLTLPRVDTPSKVEDAIHAYRKEVKDTVQKVERKPDDTTCAIIYLRGDPIADRDARATRDFLASKRPGNLKYYPLIDTDATWFLDKGLFRRGSTDIQLYYNCDDSVHRDLAKRVYYRLSEGLSGNKYGIDKYTGVYEVIDSSQKGHGVLKGYQFNSVAEWKLAGINTGLQSYAVSVIIAPYSLDTTSQKYLEEP